MNITPTTPLSNRSPSQGIGGCYQGPAPLGYAEYFVVDTHGVLVLRVTAREDIARDYDIESLAGVVMAGAVKIPAPVLRVVR